MVHFSPWIAFRNTLSPGDQQLLEDLAARRQAKNPYSLPLSWGPRKIVANLLAFRGYVSDDPATRDAEIALLAKAARFFEDKYVPPPEEGRTPLLAPSPFPDQAASRRWGRDLKLPMMTFDDPRQGGRGLGLEGGRRPVGPALRKTMQDFSARGRPALPASTASTVERPAIPADLRQLARRASALIEQVLPAIEDLRSHYLRAREAGTLGHVEEIINCLSQLKEKFSSLTDRFEMESKLAGELSRTGYRLEGAVEKFSRFESLSAKKRWLSALVGEIKKTASSAVNLGDTYAGMDQEAKEEITGLNFAVGSVPLQRVGRYLVEVKAILEKKTVTPYLEVLYGKGFSTQVLMFSLAAVYERVPGNKRLHQSFWEKRGRLFLKLALLLPEESEKLLLWMGLTINSLLERPLSLEELFREPIPANPTEGGPTAAVSQGFGEPWEERLEGILHDPNFNPALRIDRDPASNRGLSFAARAGIFVETSQISGGENMSLPSASSPSVDLRSLALAIEDELKAQGEGGNANLTGTLREVKSAVEGHLVTAERAGGIGSLIDDLLARRDSFVASGTLAALEEAQEGLETITGPRGVAPLSAIARPLLGKSRSVDDNIVVVVGGGNMGSGIAYAAISAGYEVRVYEMYDSAAEKAKAKVEALIEKGVEKRKITPERAAEMRGRLSVFSPSTPLRQVVDNAGLVIEAIFENRSAKETLFADLVTASHPDTLFVSNTSSFKIGDLAQASGAEGRLVGAHFFNPPFSNRLLELIVPGDVKDPVNKEAKLRLLTLSRRLGKVAISAPDSPGFIVNRFFVPWLNEAATLLDSIPDSLEIPDGEERDRFVKDLMVLIDREAKALFGVGMGPFALMNFTGVPIALHSAITLTAELGAFYAPASSLVSQVEELKADWPLPVDDKGEDEAIERLKESLSQYARPIRSDLAFEISRSTIHQSLTGGVAFAISDLLGQNRDPERIQPLIKDIELGTTVGLAWGRGLTFLTASAINDLPTEYRHERMGELRDYLVGISGPANSNVRLQFNPDTGVARIQILRPAKRNALNEEVVEALAKALDELDAVKETSNIRTVVFEGLGGDFGAGADLGFFVDHLREGKIDPILDFTREGLELFDRISALKAGGIRAIAVVDGAAWGGGFEMALAVGEILATDEAQFALPETLLGIVPGLKGGARLAQRIGRLAGIIVQFTTSAQKPITGRQAFEMGIADHLVSRADLDRMLESGEFPSLSGGRVVRASKYWGPYQNIAERYRLAVEKELVQALIERREINFGDFISASPLAGDLQARYDALLVQSKGRPRFALEAANRLTRLSLVLPRGNDEILRELRQVFENPIALEGLSAAVERRKPNFAPFEKPTAPTEGGPTATVSADIGADEWAWLGGIEGDPLATNPALRRIHEQLGVAGGGRGIFAATSNSVPPRGGSVYPADLKELAQRASALIERALLLLNEICRARVKKGADESRLKPLRKIIGDLDQLQRTFIPLASALKKGSALISELSRAAYRLEELAEQFSPLDSSLWERLSALVGEIKKAASQSLYLREHYTGMDKFMLAALKKYPDQIRSASAKTIHGYIIRVQEILGRESAAPTIQPLLGESVSIEKLQFSLQEIENAVDGKKRLDASWVAKARLLLKLDLLLPAESEDALLFVGLAINTFLEKPLSLPELFTEPDQKPSPKPVQRGEGPVAQLDSSMEADPIMGRSARTFGDILSANPALVRFDRFDPASDIFAERAGISVRTDESNGEIDGESGEDIEVVEGESSDEAPSGSPSLFRTGLATFHPLVAGQLAPSVMMLPRSAATLVLAR